MKVATKPKPKLMQWDVAAEALSIAAEALKIIGDEKLAAAVNQHSLRMVRDHLRLFDTKKHQEPPPLDFTVLQAIVRSENSVVALCCPGRVDEEVAKRLNEHLDKWVTALNPSPGQIAIITDGATLQASGDADVVNHGTMRFYRRAKSP